MTRPEEEFEKFIPDRRERVAPGGGTEAEDLIATWREKEKALAEFYQGDADPGRKLALAVSRGDADFAARFIAEGADVNRQEKGRLPLIHEASGLGHRAIVDALLASGRCDLTIRDFMGRLPSDVAGTIANDHELADRLADEQAKQVRAKKMDPRRPDNPDYGNWRWESD